ncbi:hypothetical protein K5D34_07270 [Pseudomonas cichorii]|uniref:Uncharacterized protein n=1 Tax=Pseudomonas lijiangensis TaxID=2995658 RepID=A0ABX8HQ38_9PSED|nr:MULTISPECIES: hypothetical protein [Pseudomonas syringae group]MBX8502008.1 hypothetical protein [Pseudomonas lijiangensis]MBX8506868.1 hypothetical protein [Pseudomonas lijiangensis]MBX8509474.1 hypothetical protein [Pseudomonas cichorii]MBX8521293.1 hypothetical protein [Pseudomonas cichorii]MBX8524335.1 hypothetical protein [Pseudomonas cichorii]
MDEFKVLFAGLDVYIYLGLLLLTFIAIKYKSEYAASLFIGCCSIPLSAFCYLLWVHGSGGGWNLVTFLVVMFAFSQVGWLGGALAIFGKLINARYLKKAGLWVSIVSVISHGLFLISILTLGAGS